MQSALSEFDLYLLAEGTHYRAYEKLGAHLAERDGRRGVHFAVWAPNAKLVSVIGDFNDWNPAAAIMRPSSAGVWEGFVPDIGQGAIYKYHIESRYQRLQGRQGRSLRVRRGDSPAHGLARVGSRKLLVA